MSSRFRQGFELSQKDRAVTDSLKALRTLRCQVGISIDPGEVLGQPGYIEERRRGARLV